MRTFNLAVVNTTVTHPGKGGKHNRPRRGYDKLMRTKVHYDHIHVDTVIEIDGHQYKLFKLGTRYMLMSLKNWSTHCCANWSRMRKHLRTLLPEADVTAIGVQAELID